MNLLKIKQIFSKIIIEVEDYLPVVQRMVKSKLISDIPEINKNIFQYGQTLPLFVYFLCIRFLTHILF